MLSHPFPRGVPITFGVQWSKLIKAGTSQQERGGHCAFYDVLVFLLRGLTQHDEVQAGRTFVSNNCSPVVLSATEL